MKKPFSKAGAILLAMVLVFSLSPASALAEDQYPLQASQLSTQAQSVNPVKVNEAVGKFTDALSKFFADTSKMSEVSSFLTRFGGLTSAASGALGVLQIFGVLKDPTQVGLEKILDAINSVKDQLEQIDKKLDAIHQELINVAVSQQEINRNNKATTMLHYWNEFNTHYCEPLNNKMAEYQGLVNAGIKKWWGASSHDGIWVLYAKVDKAPSLTYAKAPYEQGKPKKADNGESVLADASFGVPASLLPKTASIPFDVNTYQERFTAQMAGKFVDAANNRKLNATNAFYASWDKLSSAKKNEKARAYAADILNTQIYKTSCQVMSENDKWVISVLNAYRNYCSNVTKQDSGVNAMLNAIYNSHGFEGEAKDDINKLLDGLTVQAGYFGQFALTCACQDSMQTIANRQTVQQQFIDTVTSLSNKKSSALTGHDNYCYVTGTVLTYEEVDVISEMSVHVINGKYKGHTSADWKTGDPIPNMLNNVYAQVLYRQYRANTQGCENFVDYLNKYGVDVDTDLSEEDSTGIMTHWGGASSFDLNEGITMTCDHVDSGAFFNDRSNFFKDRQRYRVNVGNDSRVDNDYFHVHDKVIYDTFDLTNGTLNMNQVACARALYGHNWGSNGEPWVFMTNNLLWSFDQRGSNYDLWNDYSNKVYIPFLKSTSAHDFNGENDDNPFFAFGAPSLTEGVSDAILPIAGEDERTPLTDLVLQSDSYTYAGSAVEPSAKVLAGEAEVPEDGYDITYIDNDKAGTATVIATGKGSYSGKVSKTFEITEKQTGAAAARTPSTGDPLATPFALAVMLAALATALFAIALKRRE